MDKNFGKISLGINVLLIIAVIILFTKMPSGGGSESLADGEQEQIDTTRKKRSGDGVKMAYINNDSLTKNYKYVKDVQRKLEEEQKNVEQSLQTKIQEYQNWERKLQEQAPTMLKSELEEAQMKAMKKQQELQQYEQQLQMQLAQTEQDLLVRHIEKVQKFLKTYAEERGYDYVFGYQLGGNLLYGDTVHDITEEVIVRLNKEYEGNKVLD